jgi:uncharacterized membrane protein HdeD (DUF308 family)
MNTEMVSRELNRGLSWLIALGILMILPGIAAIREPSIATIVVARVLNMKCPLENLVTTSL